VREAAFAEGRKAGSSLQPEATVAGGGRAAYVAAMKRRMLLSVVIAASLLATACSIPRWPVSGTMTSPYGVRMRGWSPTLHHGVDIAAPEGTPVRAMQSGRVEHAGAWGGYGLSVVISHGSNVRTLYAHLSRIDVRAGERVGGGAVIGAVGRTGNATGPHLHFEVWRWGRAEDPVPLLGGFPPAR
jgi:murein DD-endopeptidase MepM/ murein hydrolase activator NlpD